MIMRPYFQDAGITIYHGDSREVLPHLKADTVITDPVWPNAKGGIVGNDRAFDLYQEVCDALPASVIRCAVQLGCDSNPMILVPTPGEFFRVCWLEYVCPHHKGRLLYGSDVAYLFGKPPKSREGCRVIPGRCLDTSSSGKECNHPCPRKLSHVKWLVRWWSDPSSVILDPFSGGGHNPLSSKRTRPSCNWDRDRRTALRDRGKASRPNHSESANRSRRLTALCM
jgi:hypothetical protein